MSVGIIDTTVILHYFRKEQAAVNWVDMQANQLSLIYVTWMEVMLGASNKVKQVASKQILSQFEIQYLTISDQQWAMEQLERYQLSHQIGMNDCQIASVAYRLQIPLYTHNLKDMTLLLGNLAQKPY